MSLVGSKRVVGEQPDAGQLEVQAFTRINYDRMEQLIPKTNFHLLQIVHRTAIADERRMWIAVLSDIWEEEEFGMDLDPVEPRESALMADQLGIDAEFAAYNPSVEVFVLFTTREGVPLTPSGCAVPALVHPRSIQRW